MKKYYIDENGNKFSYDYEPQFDASDGMTEISAEEYWGNTGDEISSDVVVAEISEVLNES